MVSENQINCPCCDELISINAKKCKHCNEWLVDKDATHKVEDSDPITQIRLALASKYELLERVGQGGMAVVYKARHKKLNRLVALKVVHQNLIHDAAFLKRFYQEARLSASLSHPNIVEIHDVDTIGDYHYLAMEFLDGMNLHQKIKEKRKLTVKETTDIIIPIANALDHAHRDGIIHRDVKSANIFITRSGRPVLVDFGIAHAIGSLRFTRTDTIIGTPAYMSPEQAKGRQVEPVSDLYSLGVVMYECLTGTVPFTGDSLETLINKIINEQPAPLSDYDTDLPQWINETVLSLLEKTPENRPGSGAALIARLEEQETLPGTEPFPPVPPVPPDPQPGPKPDPEPETVVVEKEELGDNFEREVLLTIFMALGILAIVIITLYLSTVISDILDDENGPEPPPVVVDTAASDSTLTDSPAIDNTVVEESSPATWVGDTVVIGRQLWMAENLNVSYFSNGEEIPEARTHAEWVRAGDNKKPAWCYYKNDSVNGAKYGKLYNGYAVIDRRGLAPKGWHVPIVREWTELEAGLGKHGAGAKMKSTVGWKNKRHGTNQSSFSGLPGGIRYYDGIFKGVGSEGCWWTATPRDAQTIHFVLLEGGSVSLRYRYCAKKFGVYVRCVRD